MLDTKLSLNVRGNVNATQFTVQDSVKRTMLPFFSDSMFVDSDCCGYYLPLKNNGIATFSYYINDYEGSAFPFDEFDGENFYGTLTASMIPTSGTLEQITVSGSYCFFGGSDYGYYVHIYHWDGESDLSEIGPIACNYLPPPVEEELFVYTKFYSSDLSGYINEGDFVFAVIVAEDEDSSQIFDLQFETLFTVDDTMVGAEPPPTLPRLSARRGLTTAFKKIDKNLLRAIAGARKGDAEAKQTVKNIFENNIKVKYARHSGPPTTEKDRKRVENMENIMKLAKNKYLLTNKPVVPAAPGLPPVPLVAPKVKPTKRITRVRKQ